MNNLLYADETTAAAAVTTAGTGPVVTFVLLLLIGMSIGTWAIVGYTIWRNRKLATADDTFLEHFYRLTKLRDIVSIAKQHPHSGAAQMFLGAHEEIETARMHGRALSTDTQLRLAERAMERTMSDIRVAREQFHTFLASTASGAPFIGLFGTVWGIMNSFEAIGQLGSASLAVVAPGISEALIATATGLAAAIPAALAYNAFQRRLEEEDASRHGFRLELLNLFEAYILPGTRQDGQRDGTRDATE